MGWITNDDSTHSYDFTPLQTLMVEAAKQHPTASRMELAMMTVLSVLLDTQAATSSLVPPPAP